MSRNGGRAPGGRSIQNSVFRIQNWSLEQTGALGEVGYNRGESGVEPPHSK